MSKSEEVAVDVQHLQMAYGDKIVLKDVNFTVNKGEIVVLLGPNGAGKTTTIEILEGFRARSGGRVTVLGKDPQHADEEWRSKVGIVMQSWRDHSRWRVRTLLNHLGKYYIPYATDKQKRPIDTDELLEAVGLTEHAAKKVGQLSGGQRRRLDVAIGLVGNPELLFLDEPTVGFDPKARREFHEVIHKLSELQGTAILLTTHDLDEAEKLSDRIIILDEGEIVANGSADALARQVAGKAEVIWTQDGTRHVHSEKDATNFVRRLLTENKTGISHLEVRRASLEDTYMTIVLKKEDNKEEEKK